MLSSGGAGIRSIRRECIRIYSFFSSGKVTAAVKFARIFNVLDVLRDSLILVSGLVHLPVFFMKSHCLAPNHLIDWVVKETKFDKKGGSVKLIDNLIGQYNRA